MQTPDNANTTDKNKKILLIAVIVATLFFFLSIFLWKYYNDNKQEETKDVVNNNTIVNKILVDNKGNIILKTEINIKNLDKDSKYYDDEKEIKKEKANEEIKKAMKDNSNVKLINKITIKNGEKCEELQD